MRRQNTSTTIKTRIQTALLALAVTALVPAAAWAHGGEEHVTGTVAAISPASVTVKTTAGKSVDVGFDAKTTYERSKKPIQESEIKVGDRIVIHAVEVNEKLTAHTVEVSAAAKADKR
jgi:hypothetical protein